MLIDVYLALSASTVCERLTTAIREASGLDMTAGDFRDTEGAHGNHDSREVLCNGPAFGFAMGRHKLTDMACKHQTMKPALYDLLVTVCVENASYCCQEA